MPVVKTAAAFAFVCLCWVFFRSADLDQAWFIIRSIVTWNAPGTQTLPEWTLPAAFALAGVHFIFWRWKAVKRILVARQSFSMALIGAVFALALLLLPQSIVPFIYFQF